ncbi:MAG TPA: potassium-transporting ATPase subunit B, partial [Opitutaceae bacterium]|nr:potassium-transporting ATPase subunit B [Opitutaceae bacterium]
MSSKAISLFDRDILRKALTDSLVKLNPRQQVKNPVMFVTLIGALLTFEQLFTSKEPFGFVLQVALWLLFTVIFANFAEAVAEGRGKAQAQALRSTRRQLVAQRRKSGGGLETVDATQLRRGDLVVVTAGEVIPGDGDVVEGAASVDESAITGESAPVIREAGGDRSAVTGGTTVLSDSLVIRVTANPGEGFLDHMISLVEGASRQ